MSDEGSTNIGTATLICGWLFGSLALLTLVLLIWSKRVTRATLGPEGHIIIIATGISIALTIQTNWAVAAEGEGNHIQNESLSQIGLIAKVRAPQLFMKRGI